ncbi:MAG: indolepyruvate ferredoxin oxidoreductase subunit alpha [Bacillota bacterium]
MKKLLSGNEAIARGAYEAGVKFAAAYPGTPSTEILENIAQYDRIEAQWAPNEKVALEVALGASIGGARALAAMKHVGVNVAADPLMSLTYTGVNGGFVLVAADDPGMHSSQNEQDSRYWGLFAKIPVIEPGDSQEAKDYLKYAFEVSEKFDTPVILRSNTRISHSKSVVELAEPQEMAVKDYEKIPEKYVILPRHARMRHTVVEARRKALEEFAGQTWLNRIEWGDKDLGIITSSVNYQYVKEVYPTASILKLGLAWPLNEELIKGFAAEVDRLIVVEELEPIFETQIKAMGISLEGKSIIPREGEFDQDIMAKALLSREIKDGLQSKQQLPVRPPILCPGCPHRGTFYVLTKMKLTVTGDIGCYTLGAAPPFNRIDTTICMGASVGALFGIEKAHPELVEKSVGVIGDSTFFHSGITGLLDMVYNGSTATLLILDNSTTAMTGHQQHPGTGKTLKGKEAPQIMPEDVVRGVGVNRVRIVDPFSIKEFEEVLTEELAAREVSVIILRRECALTSKAKNPVYVVDHEQCNGCKMCLKVGCPALSVTDKKSSIDPILCFGCGLCSQVCPKEAIGKVGVQ